MSRISTWGKFSVLLAFMFFIPFLSFGISSPGYGYPNYYNQVPISTKMGVHLYYPEYACQFQISQDSTFKSKMFKDTLVDSSALGTIVVKSMSFNKKYFWRARAIYHKDTSIWSVIWSFTTLNRPLLSLPLNNGIGGDTLSALAGTPIYIFQVDTDSSFKTSALQNIKITVDIGKSSYGYAGASVKFGKTYYWRVKGIQGKDTSLWSIISRFYTGIDTLNSLSNNYVNADDSLTLKWSNLVNAKYFEFQCDSSALFNSKLKKDIIFSDKNYLASLNIYYLHYNTKYYWRIRDIRTGDTSVWTKAWIFTTSSSPQTNGPYNNQTVYFLTQKFAWYISGTSNKFIVELDSSKTFNSPFLKHRLVQGFYTYFSLQYNKTYYWRVRVYNSVDTSPWTIVKFKTGDRLQAAAGPPSGNTDQPVKLPIYALDFGATYAIMEWDTSTKFNSKEYRRDTLRYASSGTLFYDTLSDLLFNTKYYYRTKTYYDIDSDDISNINWFITVAAPTLNYPANGLRNIGLETNLLVKDITGASGYIWQLDTSKNFTSPALSTGSTTTTTGDPGGNFYFNKWYYYRFKAVDKNDTSQWSQAWRFQSTDTMFLYLPKNHATNQSTTPTIQWGGTIGVTGYQYMLSTSKTFAGAKPVFVIADSNSMKLSVAFGNTYYWKVRALDAKDTGAWSVTWDFTTKAQPVIPAPTLTSPSNNAVNVAIPNNQLFFSWDEGSTVPDSFIFQMSYQNNFSSLLLSGSVPITYTTVDNMQAGKTYYWRVRAYKDGGASAWSSTFKFTTKSSSGIENILPDNSVVNIYPNPATDYINIDLLANNKIIQVQIIDANGNIVRSVGACGTNIMQLQTYGLAKGRYTIKLESPKGVYYKPVILQ